MKKTNNVIFHQYFSLIIASIIIGVCVCSSATMIRDALKEGGYEKPAAEEVAKEDEPAPAPTPTKPDTPPAPTVADVSSITIEDDTILGDKDAPVTFIEFSDFSCGFCKRFFNETENQIIQDYVDTGKVRFVYKNYAFLGPTSVTAAQGLWCAHDQGKYWEYHDHIFANVSGSGNWMSDDNVDQIAQDIGMNATTFADCISSGKYQEKVAEELKEGQGIGVTGTPASFINGEKVSGAQPYAVFKEVIERKLKES